MRFFRSLILFTLLWGLAGCGRSGGDPLPNIIIILADDLGYNDLSIYRQNQTQYHSHPSTSETPHIDRLASEGMRFTNFYCGAAVCSPSRAALLTGRNSTRLGIYNWIPPGQPMHLRDSEITIAELVKQAGYRTAHFGKWHLTSQGMGQPLPMDQGYDDAFYTFNNAEPSHLDPVNFFRDGISAGPLSGYSCQLVVDEAISWLEDNASDQDPFYINVWFNEPHEKVAAPPELASRHQYHKDYYGAIENMDLAVGRLLEYLKKVDLDRQTVVIFTSDNGSQVPGSNDPLRGEKAFNYEGGIRVPMIVRWPGHVKGGTVSSFPGSFTDIFPTIAAITGVPPPGKRTLDGVDLAPVLTGAAVQPSRKPPLFFFRYFHDPVCMLRQDDMVLLGYIHDPLPQMEDYDQQALANLKPEEGQPPWSMWNFQQIHMDFLKTAIPEHFELYNITVDPHQEHDLSGRDPEQVSQMKRLMLDLREEMIREGGDWYQE